MDYILDEQQSNNEEVRYAGFGKRFAAAILDSLILYFANWMLVENLFGLGMPSGFAFGYEFNYSDWISTMASYTMASYAINWLYHAFLESSNQQGTIGKLVLGIIVVDENTGGRISFAKATGRYFGKILSGLILAIGYLMMLWSPKEQTLHDILAKTLVVRKPQA